MYSGPVLDLLAKVGSPSIRVTNYSVSTALAARTRFYWPLPDRYIPLNWWCTGVEFRFSILNSVASEIILYVQNMDMVSLKNLLPFFAFITGEFYILTQISWRCWHLHDICSLEPSPWRTQIIDNMISIRVLSLNLAHLEWQIVLKSSATFKQQAYTKVIKIRSGSRA